MAVAHGRCGSRPAALKYLGGAGPLPLPEIQIFGGGAHAGRRVDLQDHGIHRDRRDRVRLRLRLTAEVYLAAGKLMRDAGKLAASPTRAATGRSSI